MDRLIYTALSGLDSAMGRQRALANNLANAQTPGFREEEFAVRSMTLKGPSLEARSMGQGAVRGADLTPGKVIPTGNTLDIAMKGDAMLTLQSLDGSEVYSRRGDLRIGVGGVLENGDGLPVQGQNGPITVPPRLSVSIGKDGTVFTSDPAAPDAPAEELDKLKLVSPAGSAVVKDLAGFMRVHGNGVLPVDETAEVQSGMLEQSNVDTSEVLVQMIEAQRSFEQRSKVIATARELDESGARLMSLS